MSRLEVLLCCIICIVYIDNMMCNVYTNLRQLTICILAAREQGGCRDGRYQNFDVDTFSICKASIYQYITIFITVWIFSLNLCKCIKYTAFCFKFLCFGNLNLPLLLKTATLWTLLLPWLTSNLTKN